jgi:diaminohydroxyphosphoribosylaminopyrimidine deaminase/5-amino-6-(5-phosphoribosylamino)uracil reductase
MNKEETDKFYIEETFKLALNGKFTAHPNPMVGAIIVKNGKILGKGYHLRPGSPHAEQEAIKNAGKSVQHSTLYINLEPCCHFGRTPPCSDLIISNKIKRVVVSCLDPNPLVNGKSIKQLKKAGIEVKVGVLKNEAVKLNRGFFSKFLLKRPNIICKSGISLDGKISLSNGLSKWITSEESRLDVQTERALSSLIFSSSKTVIVDNPSLNIRKPSLLKKILKQPDLGIVDTTLKIPLNSKIFKGSSRKIYLFTSVKKTTKKYKKNVIIVYMQAKEGKINIMECMYFLAKQDINNVFVEAGATLMESLFKKSLIDELILYISPKIIGGTGRSFSGVTYIKKLSEKIKYKINDMILIGNNLKVRLEK